VTASAVPELSAAEATVTVVLLGLGVPGTTRTEGLDKREIPLTFKSNFLAVPARMPVKSAV
jgi:hypothetical protein